MGSNVNLGFGDVLTPAQWNKLLNGKQDALTFTPVDRGGDTWGGKMTSFASSTALSGFNLQPGQTPDNPVDGDIWTTSMGLYVQIGGSTIGPIRNGNVAGPGVSAVGNIAVFDSTTGSLLRDGGALGSAATHDAGYFEASANKGAVNGYVPLNGSGIIPSQYLPIDGSYQGTWNANTNTPTITSGSGHNGDFYVVSTAGSTTINGTSSWAVGDQIRFNGTIWQKVPSTVTVSSVAGKTGAVTLTKTDVGLASVDNTADVDKPVSTAQAAALSGKVSSSTRNLGNGFGGLDTNGQLSDPQMPNRLSPASANVTDANSINASGFYKVQSSAANLPVADYGMILQSQFDTNTATQLYFRYNSYQVYQRYNVSGWSAWVLLVNKGRAIGNLANFENVGGHPALVTDDRIVITKPTPTANDFAQVHLTRDAGFTGGTVGDVNGNLVVQTTARAGITSYEWGLQAIMTRYGTTGEHTAAYSQMNTQEDGPGWAHVFEHRDMTTNPTTGKLSVEMNINANGTDTNTNRRVLDVVIHKLNPAGTDLVVDRGVSIGTDTGTKYNKALHIDATAQVGIDLSLATIAGAALRMKAGQTFALEATEAITMRYNSSTNAIEFRNNGVVKYSISMA